MSTGYIKNLLLILNFKSAVYGKRHLKKVPQIGTNLLKCIFLLSYIFSPQDQPEEEGRDELLHQRTQQGKQSQKQKDKFALTFFIIIIIVLY